MSTEGNSNNLVLKCRTSKTTCKICKEPILLNTMIYIEREKANISKIDGRYHEKCISFEDAKKLERPVCKHWLRRGVCKYM